jgi:hypothetical protein
MNGLTQPDVTGQPPVQDEGGSQDNRLSLNPTDDRWPFVGSWEDGKNYTVTLKINQVSPGEFEVLSAESEGSAEPGDTATEDKTEGAMPTRSGYSNPAVAGMME